MTLTLYHGTRDLEGVLKRRAVVCPLISLNYLASSSLELNFDIHYSIYLATTFRLADKTRVVYDERRLLECETKEALADLYARNEEDTVNYRELKRNLFVYLSDSKNTARNYVSEKGGVLVLDISKEILRKGLPGEGRMVLKTVGLEESLKEIWVEPQKEIFVKFLMRAYGFSQELLKVEDSLSHNLSGR